MAKRIESPAVVRQWAKDNLSSIEGLPEGYSIGDRGRLHPAVHKAFNKAHKNAKSVTGEFVPTTLVRFKRTTANGRTVPGAKAVDLTQVRAAAKAAGVVVKDKGRLPEAVKQAYAAGTLADLAPKG